MSTDPARTLSRRTFLVSTAVVGGGLTLAILTSCEGKKAAPSAATEVSAWLSIDASDNVLLRVPFNECGNGAMTMVALLMAEELRADWSKVRAEPLDLNRDKREQGVYKAFDSTFFTFSGRSTSPDLMRTMRQAGASARERLKMAAAQQWNVPVAEVEARNSALTHAATKRTLRYGEVAAAAAGVKLPQEPVVDIYADVGILKDRVQGKLVDPQIVTGATTYGIDVKVPGMVYGALMQSPVHGGRLKSYDFEAIRNMPGVIGVAVVDPDEPRKLLKLPLNDSESRAQSTVAVVAEHYWQARQALEALPIEWDDGEGGRWKTTADVNAAALARLNTPGEKVERETGDALGVLGKSRRVVDATYLTPFADQAPLEPLNATAHFADGKIEVWHNGAIQAQSFAVAAEEADVPFENVKLHPTMLGGHFGRRNFSDDLRLVVAVAKKFPGKTIQIIWSREEMFRQGRYRWLTAGRLRAALGKDGLPTAFHSRLSRTIYGTAGINNVAYTNGPIPNVRLENSEVPMHVRWGSYRAPGYNSYAFMMETFIDECAAKAGIEPLEYRRKLLKDFRDPGWIKSLDEVAARSDWGKPLPKGQGRGIAISNWGNWGGKDQVGGTTAAVVAHVDVSREGVLKVLQLDIAFDCGRVFNRDAVEAQMQGGILFGLNMALNEELNIENGRIVEGNFDTYPMLRMADTPRLRVHFGGLTGAERSCEVGEPPVGPVGPAVANAIYAATGKRIRTMPFRKHDLSWA
ncbi:MAG TPA: molybdopterin cofactor-binding domain-containing protein [Steroidobacteraceae bacterium]|nr:molybdopterin cofactor-binding domain-containing protein [Steroidobacteraceae bacterium]